MTEVVPTNVADITGMVYTLLRADTALLGVTIERAEPINTDAARCPWLGIYRANVKYPPRGLGHGTGFRYQNASLVLVAQASGADGPACESALETLIQNALRVVFSNANLGGLANGLGEDVDVVYPDYQKTDRGYMQTAVVYFLVNGVINVR